MAINETKGNRSKLHTPINRRRMMKSLVALAAVAYVEMRYVEPNWIGGGRHRVPILPAGSLPIRIVQLSDLHVSDQIPLEFIEHAIDLGLNEKPDLVCLTGDHWDLMLPDHTHGGQLTLPWGSTPFAPVRDKRYVRGLHRWNKHWLHITKGVGSMWNMRLNCFPEVSVVDLVSVES